jgi:hypothetical protein
VVVQLARRAPLRDDQATPFLLMLPHLYEGQTDRQIAILQRLLAVAPDHRGALWVLGGLLRTQPGREMEGLVLQRRAAALGVERVYPVTDASLAALK